MSGGLAQFEMTITGLGLKLISFRCLISEAERLLLADSVEKVLLRFLPMKER